MGRTALGVARIEAIIFDWGGTLADYALVEFEQSMKKEPNRFRGLYGAALAAEAAGDAGKARTYYARLVDLCRESGAPVRPELEAARKKTN